jgi:hypothetical protein
MGQAQAQMRQRDQHPVGERQLMLAPRPGTAAAPATRTIVQAALPAGLPRPSQLGDQLAQVLDRYPGEDRLQQGRTAHGDVDTHP